MKYIAESGAESRGRGRGRALNPMGRGTADNASAPSRRRMRVYTAAAAFFWQTLLSLSVRIMNIHIRPCHAFLSLQMSSLRQGGKRQSRSASFKKLSSLSSTPFPSMATPKRSITSHVQYNATSWSNDNNYVMNDDYHDRGSSDTNNRKTEPFARQSPFPAMPSPLFTNLAQSQFELLSNSLVHTTTAIAEDDTMPENNKPGTPKISSMALYLPKENTNTGQLEFVPAVTYPNPSSERVFIASESSSNRGGIHQPPMIPSVGVLGLPGFFKARDLIPTYPFVSSASDATDGNTAEGQEMFTTASSESPISVSVVEEISTAPNISSGGPTSLSVTLFSGLDTLGVLMVWPYKSSNDKQNNKWKWTASDKLQVTRAAKSLALALSMDNERASTQLANEQFRVAMADSLHQVKSPLQALRTFGKLLQRQLAEEKADGRNGPVMERIPMSARRQQQAMKLAEDMMSQGERVVDLIGPMDAIVQNGGRYLLRGDIKEPSSSSALILQPSTTSAIIQGDDNTTTPSDATDMLQLPPSMPVFGDFEMEMTFPQDVLGSIVYASQAISREKGINFDAVGFEPDNLELPGVTVCPKHLKEAVSNLLDNAIKYVTCRRKGKKGRPRIPQIKVTLMSNEPPISPGATLYIEDNGPGIPESERDKVFERGYRGETVQDAVSGSGLGLAIAREMISRMGGMLDLLEGDAGPNKLDGTAVRIILFREPEDYDGPKGDER